MKSPHRVSWLALAFSLLASVCLTAAPPPDGRFVPNYVAVVDVPLSTPNGSPLDQLKKGTLVAARKAHRDVLNVETADGKFGLAESKYFSRLGSSIKITDAVQDVAQSSSQFAFDLYRQLRQQDGNLFFSPGSLSAALAMTYAGAGGLTEREMAAVLHFRRDQKVHEGFSTLLELFNSTGDGNGYVLNTANRLWGAKGYQFEDVFLRLTKDKYLAELEALDFGQSDQARQTINQWVQRQTRDKIIDLIPSGVLQSDTRLVLTNAVYFEGGWESEFAKKATKKAPFHLTATDEIQVLTMEQQHDFPYTEDTDAQVLSLPYRGHEISMVVVLPRKRDGLPELEEKLTQERFMAWMQKLRGDRPVITYLPKFKMRSQFLLSDALKSLGMASAFSKNADFSALSRSEELMISEVVHQAFVDVDEQGTEAAAATAVLINPTAAPIEPTEPPKPVIFRADHPFLFLIRDNRTGAVLFMGRVQRPAA